MSQYFIDTIGNIDGLKIFGPKDINDRRPVFSFAIDRIHPHDVASLLNEYNIAVRAGHHCAQVLHRNVLKVPATTRASLSFYNTKDEIDAFKNAIIEIQKKFNK